jgi:heat-inducible transcriptional repressor
MADYDKLSPRDREILRDVIHTFVMTAEPVSSRTVAKHDHSLSAASIRNIMADLDDLGYLVQPHTSAGRVPTPRGYHLFIDSLMTAEAPSEEQRRLIDDQLSGITDAEELAAAATQLLSELSKRVGMVLTPAIGSTSLRALEFVPLSGQRVLCVTVTSSGFIDNKVIEVEDEVARDELVRISNYVTENFSGMTMAEIRERLLELMEDERAQMDALLKRAIDLTQKGLSDADEPELVLEGAQALLSEPELSDLGRVRKLFDTFSDKARLVGMLDRCMTGEGVRVWIGEDSDLTSELDFSLIVRRYAVGERTVGGLALFGPSRSQYDRLIPLVEYLGERLSAALAETM